MTDKVAMRQDTATDAKNVSVSNSCVVVIEDFMVASASAQADEDQAHIAQHLCSTLALITIALEGGIQAHERAAGASAAGAPHPSSAT